MSLPGLPPLPKSLCASRNTAGENQQDNIASTSSGSFKETGSDISVQAGSSALVSESGAISLPETTTSTLDTQLAFLRREMYSLRQLDLSLLSQLWALNESIQGFRTILQEQENLSPPSPSPSFSDTNSISSDLEDDSSIAPQSQLNTTNSNPPLTIPKKAHPQLPQILQQRMRRAPPPPPPSRKPSQRP